MLWFVIPVYNEAENLSALLSTIQAAAVGTDRHVILVNDGSGDETVTVAEREAKDGTLTLLSHPTNLGVHQAFSTGFTHLLSRAKSGDVVVTLEGDNTSDLSILPAMLRELANDRDVVLASCYAHGGGIRGTSALRVLTSEVANGLVRLFFPMGTLRTYSSFYRVHRFDALKRAFDHYGGNLIEERGFVCMVEMLVKFLAMGLSVGEVPMVLDTQKRRGKSKMKIGKTIRQYLMFIVRNFRKFRRP